MNKKQYCYEYPRASLTVDAVVFGYDGKELQLLLIKRNLEPFKNSWALPGGFVNMEEDLETAVLRELQEETSLTNVFLEQLYTFGTVDRDPRGRVVSVAYFALVKPDEYKIHAASDASEVQWFSIKNLPQLAFDHAEIVEVALKRIRGKLRYEPIGFELLPSLFTLTQLQNLYECILDMKLDKRNFRKKILSYPLLKGSKEKEKGVAHRSAQLYQFEKKKYESLKQKGFLFEV